MEEQKHVPHRVPQAGASARKKLMKQMKDKEKDHKGNNPKAFAITKINKIRRKVAHSLDKLVPLQHSCGGGSGGGGGRTSTTCSLCAL